MTERDLRHSYERIADGELHAWNLSCDEEHAGGAPRRHVLHAPAFSTAAPGLNPDQDGRVLQSMARVPKLRPRCISATGSKSLPRLAALKALPEDLQDILRPYQDSPDHAMT